LIRKKSHNQICIKVNAFVDEGIGELVTVLNKIEGLQTIQSCQDNEEFGYVFFEYGGWQ
jgi:hypothetical protein